MIVCFLNFVYFDQILIYQKFVLNLFITNGYTQVYHHLVAPMLADSFQWECQFLQTSLEKFCTLFTLIKAVKDWTELFQFCDNGLSLQTQRDIANKFKQENLF